MSRQHALFLLLLSFLFAGSVHAQHAQGPIPGEVLLRLAKEADPARLEPLLARALPAGVHLKDLKPLGEGSRYCKLTVDDLTVPVNEMQELLATVPGVEATSPNLPVRFRLAPNDPQYSAQWHMQSINVEPVWNVTTGGAMTNGMRIAVGINDTGVDENHPDLSGNVVFVGSAADAHGTEVAGVVGAVGNNNLGVTGVNWDVDLFSFANTIDLGDAFQQFQQCLTQRTAFNTSGGTNGAMIVAITVSWGAVGADCGFGEPMFDDLGAQGVLVITAGDNQPIDIDVVDDYPATCPHANNIVVTSIGPLGQIPFAVGNNTVHLLAPGVDIVTTEIGGGFATVDGNSFAIPHVAGAVALLYSNDCEQFAAAALLDPEGTALTVKDAILNSVTPVSGAGAFTITGGKLNVSGAFNQLNALCGTFCDSVTVSFTNNEGVFAPNWQLTSDLGGIQGGSGSTVATCLPDGCYTLSVFDDPFNQQALSGTYTITGTGGVVLGSGTYNGTIHIPLGAVIPGCTDPAFPTYDPDANCDDGSCCANQATITLNDSGGDGWEGASWTLTNTATNTAITGTLTTGSTADTTFCLPTGCYTFTVGSGADDAEISWSIGGLNIGADNGGADTTIAVLAGSPITGCMDPASCNYNPMATCAGQCLAGSFVDILVGGGDFPEDIGWTLLDGDGNPLLSGAGEEFHTICLPPGCDYVMQMTDQAGDGWNGNYFEVIDGNGNVVMGTLENGAAGADTLAINVVSGCMDTLATNYNALATCEDGTCCYGPGELALLVGVFSNEEPVLWTLTDAAQDTVGSGGTGNDQHACAVPACDYTFTLDALDPPNWLGAGYSISAADGSWSMGGGTGSDIAHTETIAVGNTFGCTDTLANNFNPSATCDDGTCCYGSAIPVTIYTQPPGPDSTWFLVDAADSVLQVSNGDFEQHGCVEPTCDLTIVVVDSVGDLTPSDVYFINTDFNFQGYGFADEGDSTQTTIAFGLVTGCTDTTANNFDPAASCDNGTCCYGNTSLVIFSAPSFALEWVLADTGGTVVAQSTSAPTQNTCLEPSCDLIVTVTDTVADGIEESLFIYDQASNLQSDHTPTDGGTLSEPIILGGTSGCTDPAASNYDPNAVCDNGTCCLGTTALLIVQPDDFFTEGVAEVTITQGSTTVFSGQLPLVFDDDLGVSLGEFGFCAANGCLTISVSEFDVPLFFQSFLVLNNDFDNFIEFNTNSGLQTGIGGTVGPEVCDGFDNDCNGLVDEGFTWYTDADGDGYGDEATGVFNCAPQPGLINIGGDCNDTNAAVNPDATEICDGQDTNCDGITDLVLTGCTDPMACNYDANAICDDGSCVQGSTTTGSETYSPDWTAVATTGDTVNLYSLLAQGKTVVLDLFAAWCPPSQAMLNANFLQDWNAHMGPAGTDDIRIVAIAVDQSAGNLAPFIASAQWPVIVTDGESFGPLYAALGMYNNAVPTLLMICPDRSVTMLYPQPDDLPHNGIFNYDPVAANALLNEKCGCRGTPCLVNIGCMDTTSCNYDPLATCPGACIPSTEWFTDNDGDGYGTTSLGISCTPIAGAATLNGDCDDADSLAYMGFTLFVLTDNPNDAGTAHYVITQGTTVIEGDLDLPAATQGIGELAVCLASGCFSISITQNDVPLFTEAYVVYPGEETEAIPFNILDGFNDAAGGAQAEVCDGVDNNCDGSVDEGVATIWYPDLDGDGYGDLASGVPSCTPIPGSITISGDCDDTDPMVNPDALDPCGTADGIDNDCNGLADDGGTLLWFLDQDGDGFGDPDLFVEACTQQPGIVANAVDCDDADAAINPAASELCDGVDNDCNGLVDENIALVLECPADLVIAATTPTCEAVVTYTAPTASACSPGLVQFVSGPVSGSTLPVGTSTVTYGLFANAPTQTLFSEDFSDNAAGWTLDTEWAIAPAAASLGCDCGEDPALDHSPSADNGVAGMNIGGCVENTVHGFRYLTSPVIDASVVQGPLLLEFWRFLHGDYLPYMEHRIQVFDGTNWVTVWESTETIACVSDIEWTLQQIEATPYKNAAFRVRFGQSVGDPGAFATGGWNVDDVVVRGSTTPDVTCSFSITVVGNAWYADADADGFGDPNNVTNSCTQPPGTVTNASDCNDALASISPLALELCDGVDDNCDGLVDNGTTPVLICPSDTTVMLPPLACSVAVTYPLPALDGCSTGSVFQTSGLPSGALFVPGTATVQYGSAVAGAGSTTLFSEDFADNSAGWNLDTEWMIGPAQTSNCAASCPGNDPGSDHGSTPDNGVAGMNIGGCVSTQVHGFRYLSSPAVDVSSVPGTLTLEFWRHLHGDYAPFMQHHVQVFDGTTWVTVWEHVPTTCINDADWSQQVIDVTAFKNAFFAVRFGQAVGAAGAYSSGGWSLDDVRVFTGSGVDASCSFTVTVLPNTQPAPYTCGPALNLSADPGLCSLALANVPMTTAFTGCITDSIVVSGPDPLPLGNNTLTYTAYVGGVSLGTCTQLVTVLDTEPPVVLCPSALLFSADAGSCEATNVLLPALTTLDNCSAVLVTNDHPGTTFFAGTTSVTWTATDAAGNTSSCVQSVTVTGNSGTTTVLNCSGDTTLLADPFTCTAEFSYPAPFVVSNCTVKPLTLSSGPASGSTFPPGVNTVSFASSANVFEDDFSDNNAGWTLDAEWMIGPAATVPCSSGGTGNDPASDHSATSDNGVAGMVIGGCVSTALHPFQYLTSPQIDVSTLAGTLTLTFWRHLHTDYIPYMQNHVQVFDGTNWVTLWSHTDQVPINDADWTFQSFDVTLYKNAQFRIRFGQSVGSSGAFNAGGWSIDDVALQGSGGGTTCSFTVTVITPTTYADADGDGLGDPGSTDDQCPVQVGYVSNNADACPLLFGTIGDPCDDQDLGTTDDLIDANCTCVGTPVQVFVQPFVLLEGPYNVGTGLMNDALRLLGSFPLTEPYTALGYPFVGGGGETIDPSVLSITGPEAVVDWVVVELRDAFDAGTVLASRAALLKRNGAVVDVDGSGAIGFTIAPDIYYVSIRHRNHLGCMSTLALLLNGPPQLVNFTGPALPTYGTSARKSLGAVSVLWMGDVTFNHTIKYTGPANDRDPILVRVGGTTPTNTVSGYFPEDSNLDGTVKYTGGANDRDPILVNIGGTVPTATRVEQLPPP